MKFTERIDQLIEAVGVGDLTGSVEMNQVYAHYQHAGINRFTGGPLVYHRGGEAHFLKNALEDHYAEYMRSLARAVLTSKGSRLKEAMVKVGETIADYAEADAPYETGALKGSTHVRVTSNGEIVYDRPPQVGRLDR